MPKRKPKNVGGRPRQLQKPAQREKVYEVLRGFGSRKVAALAAGVDYTTLWNESNRDPNFEAGMQAAEAYGRILATETMAGFIKAGGHAKASDHSKRLALDSIKFMLERKYWQEFGGRKPGQVEPDQLADVFVEFQEIITNEIPQKYRMRVKGKMADLIKRIRDMSASSK